MADRIVVMKDGYIQQVDTPQHLYDLPCNSFVAGFIGSPQMNFVDSVLHKAEDGTFYVEYGSEDTKRTKGVKFQIKLPASKNKNGCLEPYVDKEIIMGIRPEHIHDEEMYMSTMTDGIVKAKVEVTELMGAETYLYLDSEGHSLTARVDPSSTARASDEIEVTLDTSKIHLFDKETEKTITN